MSNVLLNARVKQWANAVAVDRATASGADAAQFVALFNSLYNRRIAPEYYHWRFTAPDAKSALFVIKEGEHFKGAAGRQLNRLRRGGESVMAALYLDVMLAARYHRSGILFAALNQAIESSAHEPEVSVAYLFPNNMGARAWLADPDWIALAPRLTYVCPTRHVPIDLDVIRVSEFGEWVNEICSGFAKQYPHLVFNGRTPDSLNWRFIAHPHHHYHLYLISSRGRPFAYLVLKVFEDPTTGATFGDIVDLLWAWEDSTLLHNLLVFASSEFHSQSVSQAAMWLQTGTVLDEAATDAGFVWNGQERNFLCKVLDSNYGQLADEESWYVTMSDSEIY